jgi:hypothetical protein
VLLRVVARGHREGALDQPGELERRLGRQDDLLLPLCLGALGRIQRLDPRLAHHQRDAGPQRRAGREARVLRAEAGRPQGVLGIYFFTSLYLQQIVGFSPTKAGLAFVPMALRIAVAAILSARVTAVLGAHRTVALGMAVMTVGLVLFARLGADATYGGLMPGELVLGESLEPHPQER